MRKAGGRDSMRERGRVVGTEGSEPAEVLVGGEGIKKYLQYIL